MAWISGRTIRPASGELVFVIDEHANMPSPQEWEQFWKWCEGIEPAPLDGDDVVASHAPELWDEVFAIKPRRRGTLTARLHPTSHVLLATPSAPVVSKMDEREAEPVSECKTARRTLTFNFVSWDINDGGESVASTEMCLGQSCDSIAINLRTRGTNPSFGVLMSAIPSDVFRAIAWQESRWRPFLPNGKPKSNVNTNGTTDWGLMQINRATYEEQWNWRSNLARGIAIYEEKQVYARKHLNKHPPYTEEMLENETLQMYNAGQARHYYRWDAEANAWVASPFNNYVAGIRRWMMERPWLH